MGHCTPSVVCVLGGRHRHRHEWGRQSSPAARRRSRRGPARRSWHSSRRRRVLEAHRRGCRCRGPSRRTAGVCCRLRTAAAPAASRTALRAQARLLAVPALAEPPLGRRAPASRRDPPTQPRVCPATRRGLHARWRGEWPSRQGRARSGSESPCRQHRQHRQHLSRKWRHHGATRSKRAWLQRRTRVADSPPRGCTNSRVREREIARSFGRDAKQSHTPYLGAFM